MDQDLEQRLREMHQKNLGEWDAHKPFVQEITPPEGFRVCYIKDCQNLVPRYRRICDSCKDKQRKKINATWEARRRLEKENKTIITPIKI